jgi:hypothetical protein
VPLLNPITTIAGDGAYGDGQPGSIYLEAP